MTTLWVWQRLPKSNDCVKILMLWKYLLRWHLPNSRKRRGCGSLAKGPKVLETALMSRIWQTVVAADVCGCICPLVAPAPTDAQQKWGPHQNKGTHFFCLCAARLSHQLSCVNPFMPPSSFILIFIGTGYPVQFFSCLKVPKPLPTVLPSPPCPRLIQTCTKCATHMATFDME